MEDSQEQLRRLMEVSQSMEISSRCSMKLIQLRLDGDQSVPTTFASLLAYSSPLMEELNILLEVPRKLFFLPHQKIQLPSMSWVSTMMVTLQTKKLFQMLLAQQTALLQSPRSSTTSGVLRRVS